MTVPIGSKDSGLIRSGEVPKRFVDATLKSWWNLTGNDEVGERLSEYVANIEEHADQGKGVFLVGPAGLGKTYLACALLNVARARDFTTVFVTVEGIMRLNKRMMSLENEWTSRPSADLAYHEWKQHDNALWALRNLVEFAVLDDMGKEYKTTTGWAEMELEYTLRCRYDHGLATIVTSNNPILLWPNTYHESLRSFAAEVFAVQLTIEGEDLRLRG